MANIAAFKSRSLASSHHQSSSCTRTHQIGALALVAATFFLTRLFDETFTSCNHFSSNTGIPTSKAALSFDFGRPFAWPERGFGSNLNLKIYVYDEDEIDGLKELLYGRDGKISADACVKGQWGTQVSPLASKKSNFEV